jgi:4a-hydroxytetrahydrobiopterin dehydratase
MKLIEETCEACRSGVYPLSAEEAEEMLEVVPMWTLKGGSIEREFEFKDFQEAMAFVDKVADIAEAEDHHPDMCVYYDKVRIELCTHKVNGLSKNDFIVAAKVDKLVGGV